MTENDRLRALPLADRLRIAAMDLAVTGARRALVEAVWESVAGLERVGPSGSTAYLLQTVRALLSPYQRLPCEYCWKRWSRST
jgi:hypothetical protein